VSLPPFFLLYFTIKNWSVLSIALLSDIQTPSDVHPFPNIFDNGRFYAGGRIIRLDEVGPTFAVRLVMRL